MNKIILMALLMMTSGSFADTQTTVISTPAVPTTTIDNNGNVVAPATTSTTTTTTTTSNLSIPTSVDDNIVAAVYDKYAHTPALTGTTLTVSSLNNVVTVSGTVTAQSQADAAIEAAHAIAGVKDVKSMINVTTNPVLNQSTTTPNTPKY